jgi:pectinesterase
MNENSADLAIVDAHHTGTVGARPNGVKIYKRIVDALNNTPTNSTAPYFILIKNGRYREKLAIGKPFIRLIGESQDMTVITFDDAADTKKPDGTTYGTFESATVSVLASDVHIENLTIENGFDYPANAAKDADDPMRFTNTQAVVVCECGQTVFSKLHHQGSYRFYFWRGASRVR